MQAQYNPQFLHVEAETDCSFGPHCNPVKRTDGPIGALEWRRPTGRRPLLPAAARS